MNVKIHINITEEIYNFLKEKNIRFADIFRIYAQDYINKITHITDVFGSLKYLTNEQLVLLLAAVLKEIYIRNIQKLPRIPGGTRTLKIVHSACHVLKVPPINPRHIKIKTIQKMLI